jgi:hypothetical protein
MKRKGESCVAVIEEKEERCEVVMCEVANLFGGV